MDIVQNLSRETEDTYKRQPRCRDYEERLKKLDENPERLRRHLKQNLGEEKGRIQEYLGRNTRDPKSLETTHGKAGTATLTFLTSLSDCVVSHIGQGATTQIKSTSLLDCPVEQEGHAFHS